MFLPNCAKPAHVLSTRSDIMTNLANEIQAILSAPLTEKLDLFHLFLLTGLFLVFVAMWLIILGYIRAATIEAIQ